MGNKLKIVLFTVVSMAFVGVGTNYIIQEQNGTKLKSIELKSLTSDIDELNLKYNNLNIKLKDATQETHINQKKVDSLSKEKQELEAEKKRLEAELQAKAEAKSRIAKASEQVVNSATGISTAYAASGIDCGNQTTAKAFIYCHESGNVADKWNGSGCYGLGQDCNNLVHNKCGADYACQDEFFTDYMQRRYGSWEKAKAFWQARVPINGKDVGNWW